MSRRSKLRTHDAGVLRIPSGVVLVTDAASFWDEPVEIALHGPMDLRALVRLDADDVVREVRFAPVVDCLYEVEEVGELHVAFALAIACDQSWDGALGAMSDDVFDTFQLSLNDKSLVDGAQLEGCPDALLFRAAADGYLVSALLDARSQVGGCVVSAI